MQTVSMSEHQVQVRRLLELLEELHDRCDVSQDDDCNSPRNVLNASEWDHEEIRILRTKDEARPTRVDSTNLFDHVGHSTHMWNGWTFSEGDLELFLGEDHPGNTQACIGHRYGHGIILARLYDFPAEGERADWTTDHYRITCKTCDVNLVLPAKED